MDTERLVGEKVIADDLTFVSQVWGDDRVSPTIGGPVASDEIQHRLASWTSHWDTHGFGMTLFRERQTNTRIGWGGLQHSTIGIGERLTVGYVIDPAAWGRGYASEIALSCVDYAFTMLSADALYASVLSTNAASCRVLAKAGFHQLCEVEHSLLLLG